jgi:hypothetical protein
VEYLKQFSPKYCSSFAVPQNVKIRKKYQRCLKNSPAYIITPFTKSTLPYPCYFTKIFISQRGTDGLTLVYVFKGTIFNLLLYIKYP